MLQISEGDELSHDIVTTSRSNRTEDAVESCDGNWEILLPLIVRKKFLSKQTEFWVDSCNNKMVPFFLFDSVLSIVILSLNFPVTIICAHVGVPVATERKDRRSLTQRKIIFF